MLYSFYSKPKRNISDTEQQVKEKLAAHQNVIITKEVKPDYEYPYRPNLTPYYFQWHDNINLNSFSIQTMRKKEELIENVDASYRIFKIPKHSGGYRKITAPSPELKALQREIAKHITKQLKYLPSNNAHGFVTKRNCKTALNVHQKNGSKYFLKLDIHDFFGSITTETLWAALANHAAFNTLSASNRYFTIIVATYHGRLPQGSPLSPLMANIVLHQFDYDLDRFLKDLNKDFVYTRYADDILISSKSDFKDEIRRIIPFIKQKLNSVGCKLAQEKTRYGSYAGRNWNLGIMYNKDGNLTNGYRKKKYFKNMLHNFETGKYSLEEHKELLRSLQGQIIYATYIEPEYMEPYKKRVNDLVAQLT